MFRITTWGESHGGGVGVVVDGCPPRLKLVRGGHPAGSGPSPARPVQNRHAAQGIRHGANLVRHFHDGQTLGTPISLWVKNEDARSEAYNEMKDKFRPSHADFTYFAKYGIRAWQGGGRASARETVGRVAAGRDCEKNFARKIRRGNSGLRQASAENHRAK